LFYNILLYGENMNAISSLLNRIARSHETGHINVEALLDKKNEKYLGLVLGKLALGINMIEYQTGKTPDLLIGLPGPAEELTRKMKDLYPDLPQAGLRTLPRKDSSEPNKFEFQDEQARLLAKKSEGIVVVCGVLGEGEGTEGVLALPEVQCSALAAMSLFDKSSYHVKLGLGILTVSFARTFDVSLSGGEPGIYVTNPTMPQ
jgi:hypothetical protein